MSTNSIHLPIANCSADTVVHTAYSYCANYGMGLNLSFTAWENTGLANLPHSRAIFEFIGVHPLVRLGQEFFHAAMD